MIGCSLPKKGCPYDTTVIKPANRNLGNPEMIRGRRADIAKRGVRPIRVSWGTHIPPLERNGQEALVCARDDLMPASYDTG